MNIESIRGVARDLDRQAASLEQVATAVDRLTGVLGNSWRGPDVDTFQGRWRDGRRRVVEFSRLLRELGATARTQADEQERTSAADAAVPTPADIARDVQQFLQHTGDALKTAVDQFTQMFTGVPDDGAVRRGTEAGDFRVDKQNLDLARAAGENPPKDLGDFKVSNHIVGSNGFEATVYRDGQGHVRIVYAGTGEGIDWVENAEGQGSVTSQDRQAVALALQIQGTLKPGETLETIGHSLGGRLAALGAIATHTHATTFNAEGPSMNSIWYAQRGGREDWLADTGGFALGIGNWSGLEAHYTDADSYITNYRTNNDLLTSVQENSGFQDSIGTQVTVQDSQTSGLSLEDSYHAHFLDAVDRGMTDYGNEHYPGPKLSGEPGPSTVA